MCRLLKNKASLKIIIFMRLAIQDKLQTRVNLKKKRSGKAPKIIVCVGAVKLLTISFSTASLLK
jgi:hypothetical protein